MIFLWPTYIQHGPYFWLPMGPWPLLFRSCAEHFHCFVIWFPLFCDLIPIVLWSDSHCFVIWFLLFCDLITIVLWSGYHCFVIRLPLFCDLITVVLWSDYHCFVIWLPLFCEIHFQLLDMTVFHLTFVYYSKHSTFP